MNYVRDSHIIAVYGAQGGVGCTTIAVNLAIGLQHKMQRVLLIDLNLHGGDVQLFLNLRAEKTLLDCLVPDFDAEMLEQIVVTHESGLKVLTAPLNITEAQTVYDNLSTLNIVLRVARNQYDFVIVDAGRHTTPPITDFLVETTNIVLVMGQSLLSLKNAKFMLDWFDQLHLSPKKIIPILNRVDDEPKELRRKLSQDLIEGSLKRKLEAQLPLDEMIAEVALRKHIPIVSNKDRSKPLTKGLIDFSQYICNVVANSENERQIQPERKPGIFFKKSPQPIPEPAPQPVPHPTVKHPPVPTRGKDEAPIKILIVIPSADTREYIVKLIAFEPDMKLVGKAANGREAVDMTKELKPDIVIMDIDLPEIDGIQATQLIVNDTKTTAVILLEEGHTIDVLRRAMAVGARSYLSKPINEPDFTNTIREVARSWPPQISVNDTRKFIL